MVKLYSTLLKSSLESCTPLLYLHMVETEQIDPITFATEKSVLRVCKNEMSESSMEEETDRQMVMAAGQWQGSILKLQNSCSGRIS